MSIISSGSCVYVAAESSMSMIEVQETTETNVVITEAPVSLGYKITAEGKGSVSAGVSVFVVDGSDGCFWLRHVERRKLSVFGDVKTLGFLPISLT
jgi:hypothetical protein